MELRLLALPSTMTGRYTRPLSRLYQITASKGIKGCFSFPARPPINPVADYLAAVLCLPRCSLISFMGRTALASESSGAGSDPKYQESRPQVRHWATRSLAVPSLAGV